MERRRVSILVGLLCLFAVAACSENPNDVKRVSGARGTVVTSAQSLDQSIRDLLALFPRNLDQRDPDSEGPDLNPRATWDQITKKYATGLSKPAHMVIAKRKLVRLSDWATRNAQMMNPPPNLETKTAASARLVLYMNMYVYGGPGGTPPDFIPGADVAVGIVTPDAPATIVTPTKHAGVQFEAGSVDENTVVVVIQNPAIFTTECSGPLDTKFCQYPQFYTFDQFPHKALLKPAKFNVCHVNTGGTRRPLADHDRLRLAHPKPASPADYTDGSSIRDGIEILPLIAQTFSTCEGSSYESDTEIGLADAGLLSRLARGIRKIASPKTAYAIDLGLGGLSKSFSAFNDVDSVGRPNIAVQSFDVPAGPVDAGNHFAVAYSATNIGTATNAEVPFTIRLRFPVGDGVFTSVEIGHGTLPSLVPGATHGQVNVDAVIPATLSPGSYSVRLIVASDPTFPDANFADNEFAATVTVGAVAGPIDLGALPGHEFSNATAINDAGHIVGNSSNSTGTITLPFLWIAGEMTPLSGFDGAYGLAAAINMSDEIVVNTVVGSNERAFRWKNGAMTDLGMLPGKTMSIARGINAQGQIVGYSAGAGPLQNTRGWIWQNGVMSDLGLLPGGAITLPMAINDASQIVGWGDTGTGLPRAWIWQNGAFTILSNLSEAPPAYAYAYAINANGVVAGISSIAGQTHAVRWINGAISDLGVLGGDVSPGAYSDAQGISADGRIVGEGYSGNRYHALLWQGGQIIDLGTLPGGDFAAAFGINALGQIVGESRRADGTYHATLWQAPPIQ